MNSIVITSRVAELDFRRPARLQRARGELSLESLSLVTPTVPLSRRPKTKHNDFTVPSKMNCLLLHSKSRQFILLGTVHP